MNAGTGRRTVTAVLAALVVTLGLVFAVSRGAPGSRTVVVAPPAPATATEPATTADTTTTEPTTIEPTTTTTEPATTVPATTEPARPATTAPVRTTAGPTSPRPTALPAVPAPRSATGSGCAAAIAYLTAHAAPGFTFGCGPGIAGGAYGYTCYNHPPQCSTTPGSNKIIRISCALSFVFQNEAANSQPPVRQRDPYGEGTSAQQAYCSHLAGSGPTAGPSAVLVGQQARATRWLTIVVLGAALALMVLVVTQVPAWRRRQVRR